MATIVTTPLVVAPADKFPVVPVANGILPDEALAITCNLQFNPTTQAILIDLSESTRKFNTVPIQGAFIDTSGSTIDLRVENSVTGQSVLAKAGLQGYYNLLIPMPAKLIAVLATAPAAQLNITMILYNTVIESEVWGFTTVAGPAGPQGPIGPAGPTGPQGPAGAGAPPATTTSLGSVIVGPNLNVQVDGTLSVPVATAAVAGVVKAGTNTSIAGDGTISVPPTAAFQTPWLSVINGAGFSLNGAGNINNCTGVGIGTTATPTSPFWLNVPVTGLPMTVANTNGSGGSGATFVNDASILLAWGLGGSSRPSIQERNNAFFNLSTGSNYVWEINNAEQMRLTSTGNLGVGTASASYRLDVRTNSGTTPPQVHISATDVDSGMYLLSGGPDAANILGGASWNGTNWVAKAADACLFQMGNGGNFDFYIDTGLTPGSTYTPTFRARVAPSGIGISPNGAGFTPAYALDVRNTTGATQIALSGNNLDGGGYLMSPNAGALYAVAGGSFTGTTWIAKATVASALYLTNALAQFGFNGGLTPGSAYTPAAAIVTISAVGLGIGVSNPLHQLELSADSAAKPTTNTWTISSGRSVKRHVKRLTGGLEIINKLRPTEAEYNGRGGTPEGQRVVSLIAEEVREILPHTVTEDADGNLGFNIHEVIHHLILSVQQLSAELERHKPVSKPKKAVA